MKNQELINELSNFLREVGTERFASLISDAVDLAGPVNTQHIDYNYKSIISELTALSKLNLLAR